MNPASRDESNQPSVAPSGTITGGGPDITGCSTPPPPPPPPRPRTSTPVAAPAAAAALMVAVVLVRTGTIRIELLVRRTALEPGNLRRERGFTAVRWRAVAAHLAGGGRGRWALEHRGCLLRRRFRRIAVRISLVVRLVHGISVR